MNISRTSNPIFKQLGVHIENEYSHLSTRVNSILIGTFLDTVSYWGQHNEKAKDKRFRRAGENNWCFYTYNQFENDLGCGRTKADSVIRICQSAGVIEKDTFGVNNKMHFRIVPERLKELAEECEIEKKIIQQTTIGYELEVALPDWLQNETELFWSLLQNRKASGLPTHKGIQQALLKELARIKAYTMDGVKVAIETLKYAVLNGLNWIAKVQKPIINGLDWILKRVEKFLIQDCGGLPVSVQTACSKAKRSIEREELRWRQQAKKCPNLALGQI